MRLETKRLSLIRLTAPQMGRLLTDLPGFESALGVRYLGTPETDGVAKIIKGILGAIIQFPDARDWYAHWLFVDRKDCAIIGGACFNGKPDGNGAVEIGYAIHAKERRSQGFATEGIRALTHWALAQPGVRTVSARCDHTNLASIRVLKKCGFLLDDCCADSLLCWHSTLFSPFICPICGNAFLKAEQTLFCGTGHGFDFSRLGYVNLLQGKSATLYEDKALFEARRAVYSVGFFDPLVAAIRERMPAGSVLDAGCGEGSLLHRIRDKAIHRVGLDIAKPAVKMAAATDREAFWCVGDLCNIPLGNASMDAIINVLTPANYGEFYRVLKPGGLLLKVIPNEGHLAEIRAMLGKMPYRENKPETIRAFGERFQRIEEQVIRYSFPCDEIMAAQVFTMTPLTAHEAPALGRIPAGDITVDITLLMGRK